ncbi:hypothetical protein HDV05_008455 [Chytridiales sp. JEL 0842]|nr:hypothetical protein HDV05_008455 [Chytridiales sp. JEL 0842]
MDDPAPLSPNTVSKRSRQSFDAGQQPKRVLQAKDAHEEPTQEESERKDARSHSRRNDAASVGHKDHQQQLHEKGGGRHHQRHHGGQRNRQHQQQQQQQQERPRTLLPISKEIADFFTNCGRILDDVHDRRERLVKISRDITINSKRMIFLLHRVTTDPNPTSILLQARESQRTIIALFSQASVDLQGQNTHRHHKSIAPGLEEYIEAVSFLVYLERGELVTQEELQKELVNEDGIASVLISVEDYLLGLADLTGELMRLCINAVARGQNDRAVEICRFMRSLQSDYLILDVPSVQKKMGAMKGSVKKVEAACFRIKILSSEFPQSWEGRLNFEDERGGDGFELRSIAKLENVKVEFNESDHLFSSPYLAVKMESAEDAKKLLKRSILIKEISELWTTAQTFEGILEAVKSLPKKHHEPYFTCSFKFLVSSFGATLTIPEQVERIEQFAFLPYTGKIDLKNPEVIFSLYEDYKDYPVRGLPSPEKPERLFFGVFLGAANRSVISQYDLKKRAYLGTTSMDAELSLVMSNLALVGEGSLVYDPFVGTGSFLVTSAHYGAFTMGSDIDGRQIRGKGDKKDIRSNVKQYGLSGRVLDTVVCDLAHHPWRETEIWDAIVCDPPYGVRAGARKIAENPKMTPRTNLINHITGQMKLPRTMPYELDEVIQDLIAFAATYLVPGGRLVYWLPTLTEEYSITDMPQHPRMRIVENCEQPFNNWSRRLITMEKLKVEEPDVDLEGLRIAGQEDGTNFVPAHSKFRQVYFKINEEEEKKKKEAK